MKELALTLGKGEKKGNGRQIETKRIGIMFTGSYKEKYHLLLFNFVLTLPHPQPNQLFTQHGNFMVKSYCFSGMKTKNHPLKVFGLIQGLQLTV